MPSLILSNPLGSDDAQRIGLSIREYAVGEIVTVNDFAATTLIRTGYAVAYGTGQDVLLIGDGPPNDAIGTDGQWYLDTLDEVLWGPKTGGYWPSNPIRPDRGVAHLALGGDYHLRVTYSTGAVVDLGNIRGAQGPDPATATTGAAGTIKIAGDLAGTWDAITVPGLAAEVTARTNAITAAIADEVTARNQAITAETTARQTADGLLIPLTQKGAAAGVATLDSGGLVPAAQLPAIAITDVFPVADQAAMLALTAQRGDVAIRGDGAGSFILAAEPASTLANWKQLAAAAGGGAAGSDQGSISVQGADGSVDFAVVIASNWGVTDTGDVYYDSAGAVAAEAGLLVPDPDRNGFAIFRPGGPWATEDDRVAALIGQGASGSVPASGIRAALDARWSVHWGSGATFPTDPALKTGDSFLHTSWGLHFYNAATAAWRQRGRHELTQTQRLALTTVGLYAGYQVYETDSKVSYEWTGTAWTGASVAGFPIATAHQVTVQTALAANTGIKITLDTVDIDTHGGWSAGQYTVPALQGGTYALEGKVAVNGATGLNDTWLTKNAVRIPFTSGSVSSTSSTYGILTGRHVVALAAGDVIALWNQLNVAWATNANANDGSWLRIERIR